MQSAIKQDRYDEGEIQKLTPKMIKSTKVRMQAAVRPPTQKVPNVVNSFKDEESGRGRFGWVTLDENQIPYIMRTGEKYCAVRMVEMKALNKYLNFLHEDIYNCTCIESYYITEAEMHLLNEINFQHCDGQFGWKNFTSRDLIVRLADTIEFYKFLELCYTKLTTGSTNPLDRCGFIRINKESLVPYTVYSGEKYLPTFYFEDDTATLKLKTYTLEGWDLSYLKFCCKVQGIRSELFCDDSCVVISLADIKTYFPLDTSFEVCWPSNMVLSQLVINGKTQNQVGQWIRQPVGPPMLHVPPSSPFIVFGGC